MLAYVTGLGTAVLIAADDVRRVARSPPRVLAQIQDMLRTEVEMLAFVK
jgi:hypothetical protein